MSSPSYSPRLFRAPCASLSIPSARIHSTPSPLRAKYGRVSIVPNALPVRVIYATPVRAGFGESHPNILLFAQVIGIVGIALLAGFWAS